MTWATVLYSRNSPIVEIAVATFTNGHRKELTGAERKAFAAEVGRLIVKLRENCNDDADCNLQTGWLLQIADKTSITPKTAYNWWSAFCRETGLSITPRQASDEHRNAFFAWLDAHWNPRLSSTRPVPDRPLTVE